MQQLLARSLSNFDLLLATEAAEFNVQYADVLHPTRLRNVAEQLNMLRNYCITLLTLKNEIVARLQQPFVGPSIVVPREQQHALEQVVMQVYMHICFHNHIVIIYISYCCRHRRSQRRT